MRCISGYEYQEIKHTSTHLKNDKELVLDTVNTKWFCFISC